VDFTVYRAAYESGSNFSMPPAAGGMNRVPDRLCREKSVMAGPLPVLVARDYRAPGTPMTNAGFPLARILLARDPRPLAGQVL
jgi:hypothetical protein